MPIDLRLRDGNLIIRSASLHVHQTPQTVREAGRHRQAAPPVPEAGPGTAIALVPHPNVGQQCPDRVGGAGEGQTERLAREAAPTITADHEIGLDHALSSAATVGEKHSLAVLVELGRLGAEADLAEPGLPDRIKQQLLSARLFEDEDAGAVGFGFQHRVVDRCQEAGGLRPETEARPQRALGEDPLLGTPLAKDLARAQMDTRCSRSRVGPLLALDQHRADAMVGEAERQCDTDRSCADDDDGGSADGFRSAGRVGGL